VSRISLTVLVQTYGLESLFQALIQRRMSASSSVALPYGERSSFRLVSSANQRYTSFIYEELAGDEVQVEPVGGAASDASSRPESRAGRSYRRPDTASNLATRDDAAMSLRKRRKSWWRCRQ
jgi:hypothetical protein